MKSQNNEAKMLSKDSAAFLSLSTVKAGCPIIRVAAALLLPHVSTHRKVNNYLRHIYLTVNQPHNRHIQNDRSGWFQLGFGLYSSMSTYLEEKRQIKYLP